MKRKIFLIFSGFNQRAVFAFLRIVEKYRIPYIIIAAGHNDTIHNSMYKDKIFLTREKIQLDVNNIKLIFSLIEENFGKQNFIILPSSESLIRFFNSNSRYFSSNFKLPTVNKKLYNLISDKRKFTNLCNKYGITVPKEYKIPKSFPIVAKPKSNITNTKKTLYPYIIFNQNDYNNFLKNENPIDFFYQEFIGGRSFYLLYYFSKDKKVISYSQENLIQQADGKSMIAAISSNIHKNAVAKQFENMLIDQGFFGLIMIELKYQDGEFYMIEANPRLWGPSQLFVDANAGIFEGFLLDLGFDVKLPNNIKDNVKYFWFGGVLEMSKKNKPLVFHNYSPEKFLKEFYQFIHIDIYNRKDTMDIFKNMK